MNNYCKNKKILKRNKKPYQKIYKKGKKFQIFGLKK